jgi:hypothetical protein
MLVISDNFIHIDHVIWQPQFKCASTCSGCYLKNSSVANYNGSIRRDILDLVFESKEVTCNQFTISLDSIYHNGYELVDLLKEVWRRYENAKEEMPDLCITVQNSNSLQRYLNYMTYTLENFLKPLSILSLSEMPVQGKQCLFLQESCKKTETLLNYNKCVKEDLTNNKAFEIGCRYADQVYLVLQKQPLGKEQNKEAFVWLEIAEEIARKECKEVYMDCCVSESRQFVNTHTTCSAGISRITVWPSGVVTGCPYDSNMKLALLDYYKEKEVFNRVKDVINYNKVNHSMYLCSIPKCISSIDKQ